jgi:hypothetical protein
LYELHRPPFHAPLRHLTTRKDKTMTAQLDVLMDRLRAVEAEIEVELTKRREELRFRFENRRIHFEEDVLRVQRAIKIGLARYLRDAHPLIALSAPAIYSLIIPIALADLWVMA